MLITLHKNARTTPAIRREIAQSTQPLAVCARRLGISEMTVRKWRKRSDFNDRSHTPHRLHTTLNAAQEAVVVALRKTLLLPLDDLLAVTREFLCPEVARSAARGKPLGRPAPAAAKALLQAFQQACPIKIAKILTDNGKEFTHRTVDLPQAPSRQPTCVRPTLPGPRH